MSQVIIPSSAKPCSGDYYCLCNPCHAKRMNRNTPTLNWYVCVHCDSVQTTQNHSTCPNVTVKYTCPVCDSIVTKGQLYTYENTNWNAPVTFPVCKTCGAMIAEGLKTTPVLLDPKDDGLPRVDPSFWRVFSSPYFWGISTGMVVMEIWIKWFA